MTFSNVIGLLGGLALFLHGMHLMSNGLEAAAGNKLKRILERLTANRFLAVLAGAGITAAIQSSSATTVMVVGFVDSGMMDLEQAMWVIMGANIGTTITAQLISLDMGAVAPLIAFAGTVLIVFVKRTKAHHIGAILLGFGVLFMGMGIMSAAMSPLKESEAFVGLLSTFSNPIVGIIAGALFTAVLQSSSATVGILQALALSGIIGLPTAVYVIFGQNIGTCVTTVLASVGAGRNAKRTTLIHLAFNILGTVVFTVLCMFTPLTAWVQGWTPTDPVLQIANMHTLFNVVTTLLLLPFGEQLVRFTMRVLPELPEHRQEEMHLKYLEARPVGRNRSIAIGGSAIYLTQIQLELNRMMAMAVDNIKRGYQAAIDGTAVNMEQAGETEEYMDFLNEEICRYISRNIGVEPNPQAADIMAGYYKITGNVERIGDHAMHICQYASLLAETGSTLSFAAKDAVKKMREMTMQTMEHIMGSWEDPQKKLSFAAMQEQAINDVTEQLRADQLNRMKEGECTEEASMLFSEMLTDFERVGDHALSIAKSRSAMPN